MSLEPIIDVSNQVEGHDAIFCEGDSLASLMCAGVTKKKYALLSVSDALFYFPCCVQLIEPADMGNVSWYMTNVIAVLSDSYRKVIS